MVLLKCILVHFSSMYQEHKNMYIPWPVIFSWILRGEILNTEKLYKQKCS